MSPVTKEDVLRALGQVVVPEDGKDVVESGLIDGVAIKDGNVHVSMTAGDTEAAKALEPLRQAAQRAVAAMAGVTSATVILTAERPRPAAAKPEPAPAGRPAVPGIRHMVAVGSGKGGVGKSTTAVNLAMALAQLGQRVGLLDADIYGPSLPRMMGITGKPKTQDGKKLLPMEAFGVKVMSMGFLIDEDAPMIWRGPMVQSALQQMLGDVLWGELDVLVIDLPPGTGDAQLTMAQRVPLSGAVIVSTPQDIALLDARKAINMFRKVDVPVLGVVENMAYYCCPNCGHRAEIFGHGGARATAERYETAFLGEIPLTLEIRETSDAGTPIVVSAPESAQAAAYRSVGEAVGVALSGRKAKPFPRIVYA
ncbi:iron-sulfur cluster carrier protein ApbC [Marinivivus vitaminiproducens]|uniref:iron-sulfur cluster carrier protein ApbC n=1 Tax=Marinivivus vitaminiproducens TaxID=3035935 RepID=UPI0027A9792D|nr:iron-sulfur cluster carrier protein ApbC [Geminicoccaceae bacterium SCSIO 64248]